MYSLPYAIFHGSSKFLTALFSGFFFRISQNSDNKVEILINVPLRPEVKPGFHYPDLHGNYNLSKKVL
jgi:hypothetical protein